ncbi:multidrug efflux system protein [Legionella quinlivanii]|uniref:Guanidinium exporter n=1 Tax=Legionella quinlivanii TaxID=45073 RepID=A0A0W0Y6F8_9GAMM|nr:quaternary ammonium compound efflux SMR transporter SugE [Legionella quinlivanii]KTD52520.1 multidrug efflux system protein [Legionella quinlivanii]MCW8452036.1 quaternary ammonium compound efflux SMR transporter SugE [Legionella quinlivanii]SEG44510.1 quaternary ammonium compound-resistance protein SugE [Legionella quinlivanii DSM 21216]STY09767.1 multidrug efflux system protein [Legionella quinlivanii]
MAWFTLILAGLFEIFWAVGLKYTDGFSKLLPSVLTVSAMAVSFLLLASSLKSLPIGTAYAVWTGIGAVGTVTYGILFLDEPATLIRLSCISLIVVSIVGLKLSSH